MALAAALALAIHLPALGYGFVRDDRQLVVDNVWMHAPGGLVRLVAEDFWASAGGVSGLWRPLVLATLWVEGRLGGWSPGPFHASNLLVHGAVCALLVAALAREGRSRLAALAAGAWFAAMPAHVEPVAWIAGRTDLWSALLVLVALLLDRRGLVTGAAGWRLAAALAFGLALLAKESAAPAVLALLAQDWVLRREAGWGTRLRALIPLGVAIGAWAALHRLAAGAMPPTPALAGAEVSFPALALATPAALLWHLAPGAVHGPDLALDPAQVTPALVAAGAAVLAGGGVAFAALARRRAALAVPVALLWAPLAALAALVAVFRTAAFGERHLYLPSLGAAWLLAAALDRVRRRPARLALRAAAAALVAWSLAATRAALPAWRDDAAHYAAIVRTQPRNATGPLGEALLALDAGRSAEAHAALERAGRLDPRRFEIPLYGARLALGEGRFAAAESLARRATALGGWSRDAALLEVLALQRLERWAAARPVLDTLLARSAEDQDAAWAEWLQLAGEGRHRDAIAAGTRWLEARPADYDGWLLLASSHAALGDSAAASAALERASRLPDAADGRARSARAALAARSAGDGLVPRDPR